MSALFAAPERLPLLLLAPLFWALLAAGDRARARRLARTVGPRLEALAHPAPRRRARALLLGGLFLALVAALEPAWGESRSGVDWRGTDVVVCLDVSRSMLAQDVAPSRLVRAKAAIASLARRARGDRLGLVVFAGEARPLVPLTGDLASFVQLLALADPLAVRRGGSDLGAALDAALELALAGESGGAAIVLFSDGEDFGGRGRGAAARCRARGVPVHAVGFGTALGGKIPAEGGGFFRDAAGNEVVSALDAAALRAIAEAGGGSYLDASRSERALVDLYEESLLPAARGLFEAKGRRLRESRFQWPLGAALLLWTLDAARARSRRR
jgi:Ca-activated chloride channel family protein